MKGEDEEEGSQLCAICFDKEKQVTLKPCGHTSSVFPARRVCGHALSAEQL